MAISSPHPSLAISLRTTAFFSFLVVLPLLLLPSPVDSRYLLSLTSAAIPPSASASSPPSPISGSPSPTPFSGSPPPTPFSGSQALSPASGSPSHSPTNAPGSNPSPDQVSSLPAPAPTPESGDGGSPSPMTPFPPPVTHEDVRSDDVVQTDGTSRAKKAGIAVAVIVAAVAVGLGLLVYKKRQDNIRRSRYIQAGGLEMR